MQTIKKGFGFFLICCLAAGFSCGKDKIKEEKVFSINSLVGDVKVISQGNQSPASTGMKLRPGDEIITGKSSIADVLFREDGVLRVSPDTSLKIDSLTADESGRISLANGSVFVALSKLSKTKNFSVKTQTTVAAVRGTSFRVASVNGATEVAVITGKMLVTPVVNGAESEKGAIVVEEKKAVTVDVKAAEAAASGTQEIAVREIPKAESEAIMKDVMSIAPLEAPVSAAPELKEEISAAMLCVPGAIPEPAVDDSAKKKAEVDAKAAAAAEKARLAEEAKAKEAAEAKAKEEADRAALAEQAKALAEKKAKEEAAAKQEKRNRVQNVPSM